MTSTQTPPAASQPSQPHVNPIPPSQKALLLAALGTLVAAIEYVAQHYKDNQRVYDFLEQFNSGLVGFQQGIMSGSFSS